MHARTVQLALLVATTAAVAAAQPSQVVVLRNGNILEGRVDHLGDVFLVVTETSEIRLPARDVQHVVATLQDAYAARRAEVRPGVVVDRVQLASWCIRQELWGEAAAELSTARELAPHHPDIAFVQRRLEVASRAAMRAARQQEVQQVSAEIPVAVDDQGAAELEALAESLPPGGLEDFARHVQPILVNGCAAGGCHSSNDPREFRLNRDLVRGVANRDSTLRNLQAVWSAIDHTTPEHSPLLLQPAVPHGGLPRPVFAGHRTKVQETLVEWVRQVTATQGAVADGSPVRMAQYEQVAPAGRPTQPQVAHSQSGERHFWEDPAAMGLEDEVMPMPATPQVRYGAAPKQFKPRDEFDPELFNRNVGKGGDE